MVETLKGTRGERSLVTAYSVMLGTGGSFSAASLAFSSEKHCAGGLDVNRANAEALLSRDQEVCGEFLCSVDVFHVRTIALPLAHVKRNISAIFA